MDKHRKPDELENEHGGSKENIEDAEMQDVGNRNANEVNNIEYAKSDGLELEPVNLKLNKDSNNEEMNSAEFYQFDEKDALNTTMISPSHVPLQQSTPILLNTMSRGIKRKKISPIADDSLKKYIKTVEKMCQQSETLNRLLKKNKNVDPELQVAIASLSKLAIDSRKMKKNLIYNEEGNEFLTTSEEESFNIETDEDENGRTNEEHKKPEERINYCERCKKEIDAEKRITEEINKELNNTTEMDEAQLITLVNKNWPQEVYKNTELITGELSKQPTHQAKVIIITTEEITRLSTVENNIIEYITGQPGILRNMTRTYKPMKCERRSCFTFLDDEHEEIQSSNIYILAIESNLDEMNIKAYKEALTTIGIKIPEQEINIETFGKSNMGKTRKLLEVTFRNSPKNIKIIAAEKTNRKETIYIQPETAGPSFADLVKGIKESINPGDFQVNVTSIRPTKDGAVMIVADGGGRTEDLGKEIIKKVNGTTFSMGGKKTIEVLDLDPTITENELKEALITYCLAGEESSINIENMWKTKAGWQIASITTRKGTAEYLAQVGCIKVGWISCRVRPKIRIERCLNCLRIGHSANRCTDARRTEMGCLQCTKSGHVAKSCPNERFCLECGITGHRGDTFTCPRYRALVNNNQF